LYCARQTLNVSPGAAFMAGYSGTPLPQKLGIKPGHRILILDSPGEFLTALDELPAGVRISRKPGKTPSDVIVWFVTSKAPLEKRFVEVKNHLEPNGGLWVAWPKKASGVLTDVTEDIVRAIAIAAGLVDNKVCAIDDTWSGLRCVVRLKDRPKSK
jgi:hypothetical protein